MKTMKRNSIVIFRSIRETLRELPPELYREVSEMIFDYALDGIEPATDASPIAKAFFVSWRGSIDAANNRCDYNIPPFEVTKKHLCGKFRWKPEEVRMFYEHCEANGWTTESGNPIKSWKAAAQNWKDRKDRAELKSHGWDY